MHFGSLLKRSLRFYVTSTYDFEITCHYIATLSVQKLSIRALKDGDSVKTLEVNLLKTRALQLKILEVN